MGIAKISKNSDHQLKDCTLLRFDRSPCFGLLEIMESLVNFDKYLICL